MEKDGPDIRLMHHVLHSLFANCFFSTFLPGLASQYGPTPQAKPGVFNKTDTIPSILRP